MRDRKTTVRIISTAMSFLLCAFAALAPLHAQDKQAKPANSSQDMQHMHATHDGGFMQGGMHHSVAKGVKLTPTVDPAAHIITLTQGPINLPANTNHMKMPQPPDVFWTVSIDGWLLGYTPRLIDSHGNTVPGTLLHHTAFWNTDRSDFLCPNKEEHIFGAGGELTNWMQVPGYGYRVHKGDRIRIETMVHNPTATAYDAAYLEVKIPYAEAAAGGASSAIKDFYPAWMDVEACGNSGYDLPAGKTEKLGTVTVKYGGVLLGVGGHMHDYAKQIILQDATRIETVATLDAKVDDQGHLISMPTVTFFDRGGYKFTAGDQLKITATYDNVTGKLLRDGAMGIVVGYFVPNDEAPMAKLRRATKTAKTVAAKTSD